MTQLDNIQHASRPGHQEVGGADANAIPPSLIIIIIMRQTSIEGRRPQGLSVVVSIGRQPDKVVAEGGAH